MLAFRLKFKSTSQTSPLIRFTPWGSDGGASRFAQLRKTHFEMLRDMSCLDLNPITLHQRRSFIQCGTYSYCCAYLSSLKYVPIPLCNFKSIKVIRHDLFSFELLKKAKYKLRVLVSEKLCLTFGLGIFILFCVIVHGKWHTSLLEKTFVEVLLIL